VVAGGVRRRRDLSLSQLAWVHHTAAVESAIADTLAAEAGDAERIRRACELVFADRGKDDLPPRQL
jgi:hypothetical protein